MINLLSLNVGLPAVNILEGHSFDLDWSRGHPVAGTLRIRIVVVVKAIDVNRLVHIAIYGQVAIHNVSNVASACIANYNKRDVYERSLRYRRPATRTQNATRAALTLDVDWFVGSGKANVFNRYILHPSAHFAPNGNAGKNSVAGEISYGNIDRWAAVVHSEAIPARLDGDAIIASYIAGVFNEDVPRAVRIPSIRVG